MTLDDIRTWAEAKRGRRAELARVLSITPEKVSRVLSGERRITAGEMDVARRHIGGIHTDGPGAVRRVPLLGEVPAGSLREAIEKAKGWLVVPDENLPPGVFALEPRGDSMDLVVSAGARIIIDPADVDLYPGRLFVVRNTSGDTTFKRYEEQPARLVPCSSNPAHEPINVSRNDYTIVGRVIGSYTRF